MRSGAPFRLERFLIKSLMWARVIEGTQPLLEGSGAFRPELDLTQ